jgi:hypothetical protein
MKFTPIPSVTADKFQGAFLGLWLVPTAVSLSQICSNSRIQGQNRANLVSHLAKANAFGFEQVQAYLSAPSALPSITTESTATESTRLSVLLSSVPGLLRYHDSRTRREQWVSARLAAGPDLADRLPAFTAEVLRLGEGLQIAFKGSPSDRDSDDNYDDLLAPLFSFSRNPVLPHNYGLSVQLAAQQSAADAAIAGLMAGAWGGRASLPVLWQMQPLHPRISLQQDPGPSRQTVIALANRLFAQWAGINAAAMPTETDFLLEPSKAV